MTEQTPDVNPCEDHHSPSPQRKKPRGLKKSELVQVLTSKVIEPDSWSKMRSWDAHCLYQTHKTVPLLAELFRDSSTTVHVGVPTATSSGLSLSHAMLNAATRLDIAAALKLLQLDLTGVPDCHRGMIAYLMANGIIFEFATSTHKCDAARWRHEKAR